MYQMIISLYLYDYDLYLQGGQGSQFNPKMSPRASRGSSIGPVKNQRARTDHSPYASPPSASMLTSSIAGGNSSGSNIYSQMMYPNATYLSLPDASWRRANSDSALHSPSLVIPSVVPDSGSSEESSRDSYGYTGLAHSPKQNDPSVIPTTVGDGPSHLEIPASVSSGSLPDLTNFQFAPPIQQSIDPEEPQLNTSPYSTVSNFAF